MKLYNTLTRQVDEIATSQPPKLSVYSCGPTVYDYSHIGHWYTYIRTDILIRTLILSDIEPYWVMNITDVGHLVSDADEGEDKLEKGARREGKTAWEVAQLYTQDFLEGMQKLNMSRPNHLVKATDHVPEQIDLIKKLEAKGFAYVIEDGVYYDTSKFEGYAVFAQLDLDEQQGTGRVMVNLQKRNVADFALWKFSPKGHKRDMEWESPWGRGFPGWHIECSAMSMKYLGDTLDLHTGGIDHIPVHHTNEIAQSEAVTGKRFANHWMHSHHVMVDGKKISKSTGNGIRLQEISDRGIAAQALRLHVLESHYRTQAHFSWKNLAAAQARLQSYRAMADMYWQLRPDEGLGLHPKELSQSLKHISEALQNDLNTPLALALLSELEGIIDTRGVNITCQKAFYEALVLLDNALGLQLMSDDISTVQKQMIEQRETARAQKDWAGSDSLRAQLLQQGIQVKDTDRGSIWARLSDR